MNGQDELQEIWNSQPLPPREEEEQLMLSIQKRIRRFDRSIALRNFVECFAGAVVLALFIWLATRAHDALVRTGELIVAASAVWIIFYLVRFGRAAVRVDPNQNLTNYTHALVERYDRQIHLLQSVKYWYLLPMYIGLLTMSAGVLLQQSRAGILSWLDAAWPAIFTAFFAAIWWLNEFVAVRRLKKCRSTALSIAQQTERNQFEEKS